MSASVPPSSAPAALSRQDGENGFAFLVHSHDTLPYSLPYKVDDKPLARQKRRRTR
jgi:hypothetical protein